MKRAFGVLLGVVISAAVLLVALVSFLGASESGTRLLAAQAERFLPLRVVGVSGILWREIAAESVELKLEGGQLEIRRPVLALRLTPLAFDNELRVIRASAEALVFNPADDGPASSEPVMLELPALPIRIRVDELHIALLQISDLQITEISGAARWTEQRLVIKALNLAYSGLSASLKGRMAAGPNPVLSAEIHWSFPEVGLQGSGSLAGSAGRLKIDHQLVGDYRARATGLLDIAEVTDPGFDLQVAVEPLAIGDLALGELQGTVQGSLRQVVVAAKTVLDTGVLAPFPVTAMLEGPPGGPVSLALSAEPLTGRLEASGQLAWADDIDLQLSGRADNLDLSGLVDDVEARAGGLIDLVYRSELLALTVRDLTGIFNGRSVDGAFDLRQTEGGWQLASLEADIGGNRVVGSGELTGETVSLSADLQAPALADLGLDVSGDLTATVSAAGRWPDLDGNLNLSSGRLEGFQLAGTGISGSASMVGGKLVATLTADQLETGELEVRQVEAETSGFADALEFKLRWAGGDLAGSYSRDGGRHLVEATRFEFNALDKSWSLDQAVQLAYSGNSVQMSPFCVVGNDARACVSRLDYEADQLKTEGRLHRLPVNLAAPWLPVKLGEEAYLEANWDLAGWGGQWTGEFDAAARALSLMLPEAEEEAIDLPDLTIKGAVTGSVLVLDAAATDPGFSLTGAATVTPPEPGGSLAGRVALTTTDLASFRVFDYRIRDLAGEVKGSADLSGTLVAPRFEGRLEIIDVKLQFNDPDVLLDDLDAMLTVDDSGQFNIDGKVSSDGGEVLIDAVGSGLFDGQLAASVTLAGRNMRAEHPDWEVAISPDLKFDYAQGKGRLTGRLEIPMAHVRINTLPSSVPRPSDDVVVVGREQNGAPAVGATEVDVTVVLGDDISLAAAGIKAFLSGELNARLDRRGRTRVRGKLDVTGGVVSAQGQTLTLESGSIVYNGPLDNPFLDLRAVRIIDDRTPPIKVGLHIQGSADNLTSEVFSEPPMEDARALSYLVLGRDLDEGSGTDSNQLLAAAINLGLSQAGSLTSEIKRFTGLDELSAASESEDSFAVVAGKRLTNDIYLRYTYDTLTAMSAVLVRYSLTDRWHLEARSSEDSSMDIMYTIEQ